MKKLIEQAARAARDLEEINRQIEIIKELPPAIRDRADHCQTWQKKEMLVSIGDVANFNELFQILSCVDVLPAATWKDTFIHFGPLEVAEEIGVDFGDTARNQEISPVWLKFDSGAGRGTECRACFYVKHPSGIPCQVWAKVIDHGRSITAKRVDYRGGFRYENSRLTWNPGIQPGIVMRWASGGPEYMNSFTEYFDVIGDLRDLREGYFQAA